MKLINFILHEFFLFQYQYFFFLPLLCYDVKLRRHGFARFLLLAALWCVPSSLCFTFTGRTVIALFRPEDGWYSAYYLLTSLYVIFTLCISYELSAKGALFYAIEGYTMQHLVSVLYMLASALLGVSNATMWYQLVRIALAFFMVAMFWWIIRPRLKTEVKEYNMRSTQLISVMLIAIVILNVLSSWTFYAEGGNMDAHLGYYYYAIFSCLMLLMIQLGMIDLTRAVNDREVMQKMFEEIQRQSKISAENAEMLNAKYHDFKYRLLELAGTNPSESGKQYMKDSIALVEQYDNEFKSGCEPLDVILTQKMALCRQKNIDLTCIADGSALSFMEAADIYLLFGNIIDNAIEALEQLPDTQRKTVSLRVFEKGKMLVIDADNPFSGSLSFRDGLPNTSKQDKMFHGFGTKTIRYIAEKYSGNAVMRCENGYFRVSCMIPGKENTIKS